MTKKSNKKALSLTAHSVRALGGAALEAVAGGYTDLSANCHTVFGCPVSAGCSLKCNTI